MGKREPVRIVQTDNHLDDIAKLRISNQQKTRYLDRVAGARRFVDQYFTTRFGVPAYPHLDILLLVRIADVPFDAEQIAEQLLISPGVTKRYLDVMVDLGLIEMNQSGVQLRDAGWHILINLVDQNLSSLFEIVE